MACNTPTCLIPNLVKKTDSIEKQIYIISGVFGGVNLCLIILIIAIALQLYWLRQRVGNLTATPAAPAPAPAAPTPAPIYPGSSRNLSKVPSPVSNPIMFPRQLSRTSPGSANGLQVPYSYSQSPSTLMPAEQELEGLGYNAYTGEPRVNSPASPSGISANTAGGVRVLPRNPPPANFRHSQGYNDDYM